MTAEDIRTPWEFLRRRLRDVGRSVIGGLAAVGCAVAGHPPLPPQEREEPE